MGYLPDGDLAWLKELHQRLWPPHHKSNGIVLEAYRQLTHEELERVLGLIETHTLLTSMVSIGMFGGFGMRVYEDPPAFGMPPEQVLFLHEGHLPPPTRLQRALGDAPEPKPRVPGCGKPEAWDLFSRYTHSEKNRKALAYFKMDPPREQSYYDY